MVHILSEFSQLKHSNILPRRNRWLRCGEVGRQRLVNLVSKLVVWATGCVTSGLWKRDKRPPPPTQSDVMWYSVSSNPTVRGSVQGRIQWAWRSCDVIPPFVCTVAVKPCWQAIILSDTWYVDYPTYAAYLRRHVSCTYEGMCCHLHTVYAYVCKLIASSLSLSLSLLCSDHSY